MESCKECGCKKLKLLIRQSIFTDESMERDKEHVLKCIQCGNKTRAWRYLKEVKNNWNELNA